MTARTDIDVYADTAYPVHADAVGGFDATVGVDTAVSVAVATDIQPNVHSRGHRSGRWAVAMRHLQTTVVQLDNYGPWTVTPSPRPEADLQALQSRIHADLSEQFGHHGGYVFATRYDNLLAVTNRCSMDEHARIQRTLGNTYPVSASMAIASAVGPSRAVELATERLQASGGAQDAHRQEVLVGEPATRSDTVGVVVAHFDVIDATGEYTDRMDAYSAFLNIQRAVDSLRRHMYDAHGALTFFVGGDNAISICPELPPEAFEQAIEHVRGETAVKLQVGVGEGQTARDAGLAAKHALEECRHRHTTVEQHDAVTGDD